MAIRTVKIKDLKSLQFIIPNYQRGYRWTENQITAMITDILGSTTSYCLQPIVIKKNDLKYYTVIDGQQRLTTLNLIYDAIDDTFENNSFFNISYNTANTDNTIREIDRRYLEAAKETIKSWLSNNPKYKSKLERIIRKNVFFIQYEIEDNKNENDTFNTLNTGKTPLTDIELIKAQILLSIPSNDQAKRDDFIQQWYNIETKLQDNNFWGFVAASKMKDFSKSSTRIDFLFSLTYGTSDTLHPLNMYNNFVSSSETSTPILLWDKIVSLFNISKNLFSDDELFILTGTILNIKSTNNFNHINILDLINSCLDTDIEKIRSALKGKLKDWIKSNKELIKTVLYGYNDNQIKEILFVSNMIIYLDEKTKERNIFYNYHDTSWDIEHIASQTYKELGTDETALEQMKTIKSLCCYLKKRNQEFKDICSKIIIKISNPELPELINKDNNLEENFKNIIYGQITTINNKDQFFSLISKIIKNNSPLDSETENSIGNLTLLDSNTNRGYGNDFYFVKCEKIEQIISENKKLILPLTKEVFCKKANIFTKWNNKSVKSYKDTIYKNFEDYLNTNFKTNRFTSNPYFTEIPITNYSFDSLLKGKEIEKISIPSIQRDYVQGNNKKNAKEFINALIDSNKDNPIDLNFIYGSINYNKEFIPLDGQQRLTTLFLLEFYFSLINKQPKPNNLKMLDYQCRPYTIEFLTYLETIENINFSKGKSFREYLDIKQRWNLDPTVTSILKMLDIIHEVAIYKKENGQNNLIDLKSIHFNYLPLNQANLNEDLYLKMNSRGKQLTYFEILKNKLVQSFEKLESISSEKLNSFSQLLDNDWGVNLLNYNLKNCTQKYNSISEKLYANTLKSDEVAVNLIYLVALLTEKKKDSLDISKDSTSKIKYIIEKVSYEFFNNLTNFFTFICDDFLSPDLNIFDTLTEYYNGFNFDCHYSISKQYIRLISDNKFGNTDWEIALVKFYLEYRTSYNQFDINAAQYFRVVQNLYNNAAINNLDLLLENITLDKDLNGTENIKNILKKIQTTNPIIIDKKCIDEEIKKLTLMENDDWSEKILLAEKHEYFKGQLNIIFKLYDISINDNLIDSLDNWNSNKKALYKLFPISGNYNRDSFTLLRKALLSMEDYTIEVVNNGKKFSLVNEEEWKEFLKNLDDLKFKSFKKIIACYKKDEYKIEIDNLIKRELLNINISHWWRKIIINNYDELLKGNQLNLNYELYFYYYDNREFASNNGYHKDFIFLPKDSIRIGWHSELVSYCDYIQFQKYLNTTELIKTEVKAWHNKYSININNNKPIDSLIDIGYNESTSSEYSPYLWIYFNELEFDIHIYWNPIVENIEKGITKKFREIIYCYHQFGGNEKDFKPMIKLDNQKRKDLLNRSNNKVVKTILNSIFNYKEDDESNVVPELNITEFI